MLHLESFSVSSLLYLLILPLTCLAADSLLANKTTSTSNNVTATSTTHAVAMGCTLWFTGPNSDIPVATWGDATFAPLSSGGPVSTMPCGEFLSEAVRFLGRESSDTAFETSSAMGSGSSKGPLTMASYPTVSYASNASVLNDLRVTSSSYKGPRPTFRASDITGCYAMTGLETTTFVTSDYSATRSGYGPIGPIANYTRSMACSDFMALEGPEIPFSLLPSFARSPVCTSYLSWAKEHPDVPRSAYPPGVFNFDVYEDWGCAGKCLMQADWMSVLYFATKSYDGCSAIPSTTSADPSITQYAVVDGSTLTYPSMYLIVDGLVSVFDQVGTLGEVHTSPTIAIPPGGLSSLYISDSLGGNVAYGEKTLPYDPGIPTSCQSFEFRRTGPTEYTTFTYSGGKLTEVGGGVHIASDQLWLAPPIQLLTYDPAWKNCIWNTDGEDRAYGLYGIVDPPRLIHAETEMMGPPPPPPTPVPVTSANPDLVPSPGATSVPDLPKATADAYSNPGISQGTQAEGQQDPHSKVSDPGSKPSQVDLGSDDPANPGSSNQGDPGGNNHFIPSSKGASQNNGAGPSNQQPTVINLASAFSESKPHDKQNSIPSLGGLIYNAFNEAHPSSTSLKEQDPPAASSLPLAQPISTPSPVVTIANHAIGINQESKYISIGTTKLTPGGPGITLSGTPVTLDNSYNLIIGTPNPKAASPTELDPGQSKDLPSMDAPSATEGNPPIIADPSVGIALAFAEVISSSVGDPAPYNSDLTATPADAALKTASGDVVTPNATGGFVSGTNAFSDTASATSSETTVRLDSNSNTLAYGTNAQSADGAGTKSSSTTASLSNTVNGFQTSSSRAGDTPSLSHLGTGATSTKATQIGRAAIGAIVETYMKSMLAIQLILAVVI